MRSHAMVSHVRGVTFRLVYSCTKTSYYTLILRYMAPDLKTCDFGFDSGQDHDLWVEARIAGAILRITGELGVLQQSRKTLGIDEEKGIWTIIVGRRNHRDDHQRKTRRHVTQCDATSCHVTPRTPALLFLPLSSCRGSDWYCYLMRCHLN